MREVADVNRFYFREVILGNIAMFRKHNDYKFEKCF